VKQQNAFSRQLVRDDVTVENFPDGTVLWVPPAMATTLCNHTDDGDIYECSLRYEMWSHNSDELKFELFAGGFDTIYYMKDCPYVVTQWTVRTGSYSYNCCRYPYDSFSVIMKLRRRRVGDDVVVASVREELLWPSDAIEKLPVRKEKKCFWPHC